ncbi:MAG: CRTAC1 family protein [Phycisphaerales bacterium]|nr:MAG: CRTAC1 family protein [Phycisphaerales bacterium]
MTVMSSWPLLVLVAAPAAVLVIGCSREPVGQPAGSPSYAAVDYTVPEAGEETVPLAFADVTSEAGIAFRHENGAFGQKWMPESMGSGGGWFDYDGDEAPDILLINGCYWPGHEAGRRAPTLALYRNNGDGTFRDVTADTGLGLVLYGMGCTMADYDGDGDCDVYVTAVGPNRLLRNDDGHFADVSEEAGVSGSGAEDSWSASAAWLDVDNDGRLDLFVTNYVKWSPETDLFTTLDGVNKTYATPQQYEGESCRLYRNVDGHRFEDISERAGVFNREGKSLGVAVADFNDDGWFDLVVSNDTQPNFLYLNQGDGTFEDIGLLAGIAYDETGRARAGMGVDVADLANDGRLAVAIGNFSREPISLFCQETADFFKDITGRARLTRDSLLPLTFGLVLSDVDLDGRLDLVAANGHIEPEINRVQKDVTHAQSPLLFRQVSPGRFVDLSGKVGQGFAEPIVGRGLAYADYDADGDLDLLITTNSGSPKLLRNDVLVPSNWARIKVRGAGANTDALGAKIVLQAGGQTQQRWVRTGSSYLSQSELAATFGLGSHTTIDRLEIRWPVGRTDVLENLPANRTYTISEAGGIVHAAQAERPAFSSARIP